MQPGRGYPPFPLPPGVLLPPGSYPPGYLLPPAPAPPGLPGMMPPFLPPPGAPYGMVPGLLPPGGLPPRLVYPLGLPPVAPPPPAPTLGPPAGFGLAPQVIASAAPVLRIPPAPSLTPSSSSSSINASNSMQVFNTNNTQFAFLTQTSNLLNRHIFTNAQAGLPITIVAVNIPLDFPDNKLAKMFEACGKITKYVRPSDPISLLPATFAVISYAQAICAMRAVNLLRDYLVNEDTDERIDIKLGKKEKVAIESIHKSLPADAHLDDVYEPIRQSIANALRGVGQAVPLNLTAPQPPPALLQMQQDVNDKKSQEAGEEEVDVDRGESILLSEIGRFRERQMQRDQMLEEQRRSKIKERIRQLQEAKKAQAAEKAAAIAAGTSTATEGAGGGGGGNKAAGEDKKRKLEEEEGEDPAEVEAKRRRKLQVLQLLSGATVTDTTTTATPSNHPIPSSGVATGRKFGMTSSALDEDDDDEPRREIVLLSYTEEELREMEAADQSHANNYPLGQQQQQEESLEEEYRRSRQPASVKGSKAVVGVGAAGGIAPEIHQRVLAQAHLISQSLNKMLAGAAPPATTTTTATGAGGVATALAATSASSSGGGGGGAGTAPAPTASSAVEAVQAAKRSLEQIVDQIPTEKEALFAFAVNWDVLDRHDVVRSVLKAWIVKKIVQYLGEEEESLTHFIVSKLSAHCSPLDLVQELSMVLDEDSDTFVCKLWRMVVYYSLLKSAEEKDQRST
eukprot:gene7117-7869_t